MISLLRGVRLDLGGSHIEILGKTEVEIYGNDATITGSLQSRIFEVKGRMTLDHVKLSDGRATQGGALRILGTGRVLLLDVTIEGCEAFVESTSEVAAGGAVYVFNGGKLDATSTTIRACKAENRRTFGETAARGAGIYIDGEAIFTKSTITQCHAHAFVVEKGFGGGMFLGEQGKLLMKDQTLLTENGASGDGDAIFSGGGGAGSYQLPAPEGRFIAGLKCHVYRKGCALTTKGQPKNPDCVTTRDQCSKKLDEGETRASVLIIGNVNETSCQPQSKSQPCDYENLPDLLNR